MRIWFRSSKTEIDPVPNSGTYMMNCIEYNNDYNRLIFFLHVNTVFLYSTVDFLRTLKGLLYVCFSMKT